MDNKGAVATGLTMTSLITVIKNGVAGTGLSSQAYLESKAVNESRALAAELCHHFYNLGWFPGTGGSIAMRVHDDVIPKTSQLIVTSPSGTYSSFSLFLLFLRLSWNTSTCKRVGVCIVWW